MLEFLMNDYVYPLLMSLMFVGCIFAYHKLTKQEDEYEKKFYLKYAVLFYIVILMSNKCHSFLVNRTNNTINAVNQSSVMTGGNPVGLTSNVQNPNVLKPSFRNVEKFNTGRPTF